MNKESNAIFESLTSSDEQQVSGGLGAAAGTYLLPGLGTATGMKIGIGLGGGSGSVMGTLAGQVMAPSSSVGSAGIRNAWTYSGGAIGGYVGGASLPNLSA